MTTPIELAERLEKRADWLSNFYEADQETLMREAATALRASGGVGVKKLEWRSAGRGQSWEAQTAIAPYVVSRNEWWISGLTQAKACSDSDAAKAAAQADYEQRIRSALIPETGVVSPVNAELLEALRKAEIGLANAKSFAGKPLGDTEQRSVETALTSVRTAITNAEAALSAPVGEPVAWVVYDWEYTDPKIGQWSYARTPERAERLMKDGVKLTPVYVRSENATPPDSAAQGGE